MKELIVVRILQLILQKIVFFLPIDEKLREISIYLLHYLSFITTIYKLICISIMWKEGGVFGGSIFHVFITSISAAGVIHKQLSIWLGKILVQKNSNHLLREVYGTVFCLISVILEKNLKCNHPWESSVQISKSGTLGKY